MWSKSAGINSIGHAVNDILIHWLEFWNRLELKLTLKVLVVLSTRPVLWEVIGPFTRLGSLVS